MQAVEFTALLPLLCIFVTALVVMLGIAVRRDHVVTLVLTLAGLGIAFARTLWAAQVSPVQFTPLLIVDRFALFYTGLILFASFIVAVFSFTYFKKREGDHEEFYVLLLVATLGSSILASSNHFASFFLGLEILTVSLYAMISYLHTRRFPLEAGIKYLILAASSAAFLLFGMALVYAELGTLEFGQMSATISFRPDLNRYLLIPGVVFILTGIGFKLGVVPFHLWTADVYQGAPAPVTGFVATVSKGAMFALLLRFFAFSGARIFGPVLLILAIISVASMFAGNLLALLQNNVKRILAYSSIAHLGYLLVAFEAGGARGTGAATFYLVAYFVTTLGAFGVVTALSGRERDADSIDDYRGLFWKRPVVSGVFTAMLLSLAGIPLTAGFLGKFYIVASGASSGMWSLIIILVVTSVMGLFYYLRIIVALFSNPADGTALGSSARSAVSILDGCALAVLSVLLIWFGVYPVSLFHVIQQVVAGLI